MYEIADVGVDYHKIAEEFLKRIPSITDIDSLVLERGVLLLEDGDIAGIISYDTFHTYGLIRYFVFRRSVDGMAIKELFLSLEKKVQSVGIVHLFSLVNNSDIEELFNDLEFVEVDKDMIFLEEDLFSNTKFKDAKMMMKMLYEPKLCTS